MTLVTHLIRKDLRAVAITSLFWTFLMSIELALQLTGEAAVPRDPGRPSALQLLAAFLPVAEVATAALIVALVIHEDPLVDTRAFWLTRPIPRGQLFVAKLIAIAILIYTPALTALGVLLAWHHVPPVHMIRVAVEVVLWLAFPLLILTAAATLTSTLSRYLLLLFGVMMAALIGFNIVNTLQPAQRRVFEPPLPRFVDPALPATVTLILIAGFSVAIHQFYRRRDWRVALGCIALVAGTATLVVCSWPGFTFFEPPGTATGAWTANARLRLLDDRTMVISSYHLRELHTVSAPLVLDGLPEGYSAAPFTLNGRLTRADGTVLRSGRAMPMQVAAKGEYQPSLTLAYGNDPIAAGPTSWEAWPVLLELQLGHRKALSSTPPASFAPSAPPPPSATPPTRAEAADGGSPFYAGAYAGTFMYRIARHEQVASLRLDGRESRTDGPRGITVVDARDLAGDLCRVTLQVTNTELTFAGPQEPAPGYYFADRRTGEKLRAAEFMRRAGAPGPLRLGPVSGRIFNAAIVELDVRNPRGGGEGNVSACANTELIFVRTIPVGSLTRSFELPDFRVQPSQDTFFRR